MTPELAYGEQLKEGTPLVSAVIAVFNGQDTIAQAIDSVLTQRFQGDFEVIVVDDGSTDGTAQVLSGYEGRIKVVSQSNQGNAVARNVGVRASSGRYIAFLDADDFWAPEYLSRTIETLERDPNCVLVYSNFALVDSDGHVISRALLPEESARCPSVEELLSGSVWPPVTPFFLMPRSAFDAIGGFSEEFGRGYGCEGGFLVLRARERGHFAGLREPLAFRPLPPDGEIARKIREWSRRGAPVDSAGAEDPGRYVQNFETFMRLVSQRYGAASRGLVKVVRQYLSAVLVTIGLIAMSENNPALARRCYANALRYGPFNAKTYARLLWTVLPLDLANQLCQLMPLRLARALTGRPQRQESA